VTTDQGEVDRVWERFSSDALALADQEKTRPYFTPEMVLVSVNINLQQFLETHPSLVPVPEAQEYLSRLSLSGPRFQYQRHRSISAGCRYQDQGPPAASLSPAPRHQGPTRRTRSAVLAQAMAARFYTSSRRQRSPPTPSGRTSLTRSPRSRPSGGPTSDSAKRTLQKTPAVLRRIRAMSVALPPSSPTW